MTQKEQSPTASLREGFRLGDRVVRPSLNRIDGPEGEVHVEPRAMEVLVALAGRAGEVVPREALQDAVWGGAAITDHALTSYVSELRRHLDDDRSEPRFIVTVPKRGYRLIAPVEPVVVPAGGERAPGGGAGDRRRTLVAGGVLLLITLAGLGAWWLRGLDTARAAPAATVAVLPFEAAEGEDELDHLRLALPDEVTTLLTHSPTLSVRPFDPAPVDDPVAAGRAREAAHVVTGHFYVGEGESLSVTLEAVDVERERLIWQTRVRVPSGDLVSLRERIASRVRGGLLPALGGAVPSGPGTAPADPDAYGLYLRSLAISRDPEPNLRGIAMLEQVVTLEPGFAPAWAALSLRYHRDGAYGDGGDAALTRARRSAERALELDPGLIEASQRLISLRTEAGDLAGAYREASELLAGRPASAQAHFSLAYVLRFGGMLEASQRHCERALELDPFYFGWRSCAFSYLAAGELGRVERFIDLDADSYWAHLVTILLRMRQGETADALLHAERLSAESPDRSFLVACLEGGRGAALDAVAGPFATTWRERQDPEPAYWIASELVHCGRPRDGLRMLEHAIAGGYCSFPALDLDPVWEPLRDTVRFERLRGRARACREAFEETVDRR